ncbi:hypothetical protein PMIN04_000318 [Paraphaeosphaeria minitans]
MSRASRKQISLPSTGSQAQTAAWTGQEELPSCTTQLRITGLKLEMRVISVQNQGSPRWFRRLSFAMFHVPGAHELSATHRTGHPGSRNLARMSAQVIDRPPPLK